MAPFITKTDGKYRVQFPKCEIPNTYLDIEFKLTESEHGAGDDSGDEETKESSQSVYNNGSADR